MQKWYKKLALVLLLIASAMIDGCGSAIHVADYAVGRTVLTRQQVSAEDYEDLRAGRLLNIKARYEAVAVGQRTQQQTALLCDIYLKLQDFSQAALCNKALIDAASLSGNLTIEVLTRSRGRVAQIALAQRRYEEALTELVSISGDGATYLTGIVNARLGHNTPAQNAAEAFAKKFKPKPVFYAAALYAAIGDSANALRLLEDPERRLLADYGLTSRDNAITISEAVAPFRLDPFDDFTFGIFTDHSFAPAANVYVELLAAQCLRQVGRVSDAKLHLQKLLAFPNLPAYRDAYWVVLSELAQIAATMGDQLTKIKYLQQAIEAIEQGRAAINTENGRFAFIIDKQQVYTELVSDLLDAGKPETALEFVERSKSRGLVDLLSSQQEFAPSDEVDAATTKLLLNNLANAETDVSWIAAHGSGEIYTALNSLRSATATIVGQAPKLANLVTVVPQPFADIARTIKPNETALLYYKTAKNWVAFIVHANAVQAVSLGMPPVEDLVTKFRNAIEKLDNYIDPTRALTAALLDPVLPYIKTKHLIVVPHSMLHYLPFVALYDGNKPIIYRKTVRIVPSLTVLSTITTANSTVQAQGLILGNPDRRDPGLSLPGAEVEAAEVARIFPGSTLYIGAQASIKQLQTSIKDKSFLHIAAHGVFDPLNPLSSYLLLALDEQGYGDLTVANLYKMRINTTVTVMSACESALTNIAAGDDIVGLVRGFLFAGVKTVVGSYWKVDDAATKHLMIKFYQSLHDGKSVAEAMQEAQIDTIKTFTHPYYWASFMVIGGDSTM